MSRISTNRVNLKGLLPEDIAAFIAPMGKETYRSRQIFRWIHLRGVEDFQCMTDLSKTFRAELSRYAYIDSMTVRDMQLNHDASTTKFLYETTDGFGVESVIIRDDDRIAFCLSTQVGCALECRFCRTGRMGYKRNLEAWEIVDQFNIMQETLRAKGLAATHVVFMGMGEPLLNYKNTLQAIRIFNCDLGKGLAQRRMTVSTVGIVPRIRELGRSELRVGLAVSLHAPTDEMRRYLMPIGKKYPIKDILSAAWYFSRKTRRRVTFEYLLIKGINDTDEDARELLRLLAKRPAKINLIRYNKVRGASFEKPAMKRIESFQKILLDGGMVATLRKSKGEDINAACGQLASDLSQTSPSRSPSLAPK